MSSPETTAYVTYCSTDKRDDPGELPAIERYLDPRIRETADRAAAAGARFLILSGEYGLLRPEDPIPWYDHLLMPDEVEEMAEVVGVQLRSLGVREVIYATVNAAEEPAVRAYLKAMALGCARAGATMRMDTLARRG